MSLAVTLAVLPTLVACIGGKFSDTPASSNEAQVLELSRELAQCVRTDGVPNFPDPVIYHGVPGGAGPEMDPANNPQVAAALQGPCKSVFDRLNTVVAQARTEEARVPMSAADLAKARQFAQRMRDHGFAEFPDPDNTGLFVLPTMYAADMGKGGSPLDVQYRAAGQACRKFAVPGMAGA